MARKKKEEELDGVVLDEVEEEVKNEGPKVYKGYDVKWLKKEPSHPDYHLIAEYEEEYGEIV